MVVALLRGVMVSTLSLSSNSRWFESQMIFSGLSHLMLESGTFFEDLINKIKIFCQRDYSNRSIFIHILYNAWKEAATDVVGFFAAPRLNVFAWHEVGFGNCRTKNNFFVRIFFEMKRKLDTKEKNFFFRCDQISTTDSVNNLFE